MNNIVSFRSPRQRRVVSISTHGETGHPAVHIVPPLNHIDLNRVHSSFGEALAYAVDLARENGWLIYDYSGRIPLCDLQRLVSPVREAL